MFRFDVISRPEDVEAALDNFFALHAVFRLVIDERIAAVRVAFVVGDTLYLYFSGYDSQYAQYGVMTTTVAEAIQYAIANGLKLVHLSPGHDVSKTRWRPTVVSTRQATLVAPSARAHLADRMHRGALSALETFPRLKRATRFLSRRPEMRAPLVAPQRGVRFFTSA